MSYPPPYQPPPQPYQPPGGYPPAPPPPQYGQVPVQPGWQQHPGQPGPVPGFPPPAPAKGKKGPIIAVAAVVAVASCFGLAALGGETPSDKASVSQPGSTAAKARDVAEPAENKAADEKLATFGVPVGSTITASDGGDVIEATLRSVTTFKKGCNSLNVDPEQGMYVVAEVVVTQKKGSGSVNPLDFKFVADDGTTANALSSVFSGCDDPSLDSSDLRAGQKRSGKIAFDARMKVGQIEWAPGGMLADTVGSWATK